MNLSFFSTSASHGAPHGNDRGWYASLGISTAVHVCLIAALGGLSFTPRTGPDEPDVNTRWTPREKNLEITRVKPLQTVSLSSSAEPASSRRAVRTRQPRFVLPTAPRPPVETADVRRTVRPDWTTANLSKEVAVRTNASAESNADSGAGPGGEGGDFFGLQASGKRFVYVVDRSRSMNHPHESEAKTRFGRVKLELLRSIGRMSVNREFFIVFFNDEALPMPAQRLQPARRPLQERYLRWAAKVEAIGQTDPRTALRLAVRLQPDIIYFLTDGRVPEATVQDVTRANRGRVAIHTFCIGNRDGESLLKEIARHNGGEYHFVP